MVNALILVCDDAGFDCVDRGIRTLVEKTQVPVCADYLIGQEGAALRAKKMVDTPLVSVGLHFELSDLTDEARVLRAIDLKSEGTSLGEQQEIRLMAQRDARTQLALFREALGRNPAHISTHGNFNTDAHDDVLPWWTELMDELFDGKVPPMQIAAPYIRHNLFGWNLPGHEHVPLEPDEFGRRLAAHHGCEYIEFVMHPALPRDGDQPIGMLFTEQMRVADLEAAVRIIQSGVIEKSGFSIVPVSALAF